MDKALFPDYVEQFVSAMRGFLTEFGVALNEEPKEYPDVQARAYSLLDQQLRTDLLVHRTKETLDKPIAEYRARVMVELPSGLGLMFVGMEDIANQMTSLGALTTHTSGAGVTCQSLLGERTYYTTAGIMAAAMVHAAPAIVRSFGGMLRREDAEAVTALSAWTDLDFEQIHYDYAHLGTGSIQRRSWSQVVDFTGHLTLEAVDNNPYWGGGLLCLLRVNQSYFQADGPALTANELNLVSFLIDRAPAFGAWCRRDGEFVYVTFAPNFLKQLPNFVDVLIEAASMRARTTRDLVITALESRPEQATTDNS